MQRKKAKESLPQGKKGARLRFVLVGAFSAGREGTFSFVEDREV
jgi:hypothetical protein